VIVLNSKWYKSSKIIICSYDKANDQVDYVMTGKIGSNRVECYARVCSNTLYFIKPYYDENDNKTVYRYITINPTYRHYLKGFYFSDSQVSDSMPCNQELNQEQLIIDNNKWESVLSYALIDSQFFVYQMFLEATPIN